jgi:SRSO17 transposase
MARSRHDPWRLEAYLAAYRQDFGRSERFVWAQVYLAGLLAKVPRKTVEGIARFLTPVSEAGREGRRQALQNFLQESPWDEELVLQRYRRQLWRQLSDQGLLMVADLSLVKQGRHSVGVQRQYCPATGTKANCQIIPSVFVVTPHDCLPLAMRLFLPRSWQDDTDRLDAGKVPLDRRGETSRIEVVLELLALLRAEGMPGLRVALGDRYGRSSELAARLSALGFEVMAQTPEHESLLGRSIALLKSFGLDHFEGRTWRGLHHHLTLVMLAHHYSWSNRASHYRGCPTIRAR